MKPRMRRRNFNADGDYDSWPVMVPRKDKAVVPTSPERVRRLRRRLIVALRALRTMKNPERSVAPLRPEPEGFAGRAGVRNVAADYQALAPKQLYRSPN